MVENGEYSTTYEIDDRMSQRESTLHELKEVVRNGRIVREEPRKRGGPKCTIRGFAHRDAAGLELPGVFEMEIAIGVDDVVVFITAYWLQ